MGQAKRFSQEKSEGVKRAADVLKQIALEGLRENLDWMIPRVRQVMHQTRARIFHGDTHVEGKILSVFEPSTEVIRKGKAGKPNEFGKMIKLQEAENQIIVDYEVYARRPNDSDLLIPSIEPTKRSWGVSRDWSQQTQRSIPPETRPPRKLRGSNACVFPIARARAPNAARAEETLVPQRPEMAYRMRRAHQRGQAAKRLDRCRYKGNAGMQRWVGLGVISDNLVKSDGRWP